MSSTSTVVSMPAESEWSAGPEVHFDASQHTTITFLILALGGYLQLQYHSLKKSPLEEHRKIMVAIYVNLFLYGVGLMAEYKLKTQRRRCLSIIKRFTPLFGILVVVMITIILYPELGFVAFIIWALVTMEAIIKLFEEILQWLCPMFTRLSDFVTSNFNRPEIRSPGIQENGSSRLEVNDLSEENESLV